MVLMASCDADSNRCAAQGADDRIAMASASHPRSVFLFQKLPPELRNHIYDYYFSDDAKDELELFANATRMHYPNWAIMATCKQISLETSTIFARAAAGFWTDHSFHIKGPFPHTCYDKEAYLIRCDRLLSLLPRSINLRSLEHRSQKSSPTIPNVKVEIDADGELDARFVIEPVNHCTTDGIGDVEERVNYYLRSDIARSALDLPAMKGSRAFCKQDLNKLMRILLNYGG